MFIFPSPDFMEAFIIDPIQRKQDTWGNWTEWTQCSRECGSGRQSRTRECIVTDKAAINCTGDRVQIQECNTHPCPSKDYSFLQQCCTAVQYLHSFCPYCAPDCTIAVFRTVVDGGWTDWTDWSDCSATCGQGDQVRRRNCTNPPPQYGGDDCEGESVETRSCHLRHCPGEITM